MFTVVPLAKKHEFGVCWRPAPGRMDVFTCAAAVPNPCVAVKWLAMLAGHRNEYLLG